MKKIVLAIPHSHSWFWIQTCLSALKRFPPVARDCEVQIVVVDNSPWSPAIKGVTDTRLGNGVTVFPNPKVDKHHSTGLDAAIENCDYGYSNHPKALDAVAESFHFDYLMAMETDVIVLRPDWLQWFVDQMRPTDFAVGHFRQDSFVNPSCTLYRATVLHDMLAWVRSNKEPIMRWGDNFEKTQVMDHNQFLSTGVFTEKRGWPEGIVLKNRPTGQSKGHGWYEPGQQLYHWALEAGYTHPDCMVKTSWKNEGLPTGSFYGMEGDAPDRVLEVNEMWDRAYTVHCWGGTRALDILKHPIDNDNFVSSSTPFWLEREARFWRDSVDPVIQAETLAMIRKYGWHTTGCGTPEVTDRDRAAAAFVEGHYRNGGVVIERP